MTENDPVIRALAKRAAKRASEQRSAHDEPSTSYSYGYFTPKKCRSKTDGDDVLQALLIRAQTKRNSEAGDATVTEGPRIADSKLDSREVEDAIDSISPMESQLLTPSRVESGIETTTTVVAATSIVVEESDDEQVRTDEQRADVEEEAKGDDQLFAEIGAVNLVERKRLNTAPSWITQSEAVSASLDRTALTELDCIPEALKKTLRDSGIDSLFPVQKRVIPQVLAAPVFALQRPRDVCVSAATGSGKTLAYVLPIVAALQQRSVPALFALIVTPTNDLCTQVFSVLRQFVRNTPLNAALLDEKSSLRNQTDKLIRKTALGYEFRADIVVTTPTRLVDHLWEMRERSFDWLSSLRYLVLDEADRLINDRTDDFLHELDTFISDMTDDRMAQQQQNDSTRVFVNSDVDCLANRYNVHRMHPQKILLSATLKMNFEELQSLKLYRPLMFSSDCSDNSAEFDRNNPRHISIPQSLEECYIVCELARKALTCFHLLSERMNDWKRVLCFCSTKRSAQRLCFLLRRMNVQVRECTGNVSARERAKATAEFSQGRVSLLVCSDVFARGMDLCGVDCVLSYDCARDLRLYAHRVGRTARAGKAGVALTMLDEAEVEDFSSVMGERWAGYTQLQPPTQKELARYKVSYVAATEALQTKAPTKMSRKRKEKFQKRKLEWRRRKMENADVKKNKQKKKKKNKEESES